eukprot:48856_1
MAINFGLAYADPTIANKANLRAYELACALENNAKKHDVEHYEDGFADIGIAIFNEFMELDDVNIIEYITNLGISQISAGVAGWFANFLRNTNKTVDNFSSEILNKLSNYPNHKSKNKSNKKTNKTKQADAKSIIKQRQREQKRKEKNKQKHKQIQFTEKIHIDLDSLNKPRNNNIISTEINNGKMNTIQITNTKNIELSLEDKLKTYDFDTVANLSKRHKMFEIIACHNKYSSKGKQLNMLKLDKIFDDARMFPGHSRKGTAWTSQFKLLFEKNVKKTDKSCSGRSGIFCIKSNEIINNIIKTMPSEFLNNMKKILPDDFKTNIDNTNNDINDTDNTNNDKTNIDNTNNDINDTDNTNNDKTNIDNT